MDIPKDIQNAAAQAIIDAENESGESVAWAFEYHCACAILAERERCWGIAETIHTLMSDEYLVAQRIAAAIRTPPTGEEQ